MQFDSADRNPSVVRSVINAVIDLDLTTQPVMSSS